MSTSVIVSGLGFGDEGKGLITSYLTKTRHAHWNVRYNGGAQAAHHVVRENSKWHRFQQLGSGTFDFASTFLSRYVIVHPLRLLDEARELQDKHYLANPLRTLFIDGRAVVITPYHTALNQLKERSRGMARHGSTGLGVGETRAFEKKHPDLALRASDLSNPSRLKERMRAIGESLADEAREYEFSAQFDEAAFRRFVGDYIEAGRHLAVVSDDFFATHIVRDGNIIFEGAQGILLDELYGFHPHNTWTNTTTANARAMLAEADYSGEVVSLGVMRSYMSRHGAGPLPTEDRRLAVRDEHNTTGEWAGRMRYGHLDGVLLRYAMQVSGGIDEIAVTHVDELDRLPDLAAVAYRRNGRRIENVNELLDPGEFGVREGQMALTKRLGGFEPEYAAKDGLEGIARLLDCPVTLASCGPRTRDVVDLRGSDTPPEVMPPRSAPRGVLRASLTKVGPGSFRALRQRQGSGRF